MPGRRRCRHGSRAAARSGAMVLMPVTRTAPRAGQLGGVRPTTMSSESGEGSAAAPIVPTCAPGKRSPSWSAGVTRSSSASAGEA